MSRINFWKNLCFFSVYISGEETEYFCNNYESMSDNLKLQDDRK